MINIEIKPRKNYIEKFLLMGENILISNVKKEDNGVLVPQYEDIILIQGNTLVLFCCDSKASDPFNVSVTINTKSIIQIDKENIQGISVYLKTREPLSLSLNPDHILLLRKCFDLNILYHDGLDNLFAIEDKKDGKNKDTPVNLIVDCPGAIANVSDFENEFLLELRIRKINVNALLYGTTRVTIKTGLINFYDKDCKGKKALFIQSNDEKQKNGDEKEVLSVLIEFSEKDNETLKSLKFHISNQLVIGRINTLFSALHFLKITTPSYERAQEKPNKCKIL